MLPSTIRPYRLEDRSAVHEIAANTAYFGQPAEAFMPDRRVILDVFVSYYTDYEPEHAWVAEVDGRVAGYLTGCADSEHAAKVHRRLALAAAGRMFTAKYRLGRAGWRYVGRIVLATLRGDYPHPDLRPYPAHLHINVADGYRGYGLGRRLLHVCFDQMVGLGIPGIHLRTTTMNHAAARLYESAGFRLLARKRTRLWEYLLPGKEIDNLVYGKHLGLVSGAAGTT